MIYHTSNKSTFTNIMNYLNSYHKQDINTQIHIENNVYEYINNNAKNCNQIFKTYTSILKYKLEHDED